jgi:hypothetical protein
MRQTHPTTAGYNAHGAHSSRSDRPLLLSLLSETGIFETGLSENYSLERMIDRLDQRETL